MDSYRTDLAVELKEISACKVSSGKLEGVSVTEETVENLRISEVDIKTIQAGERLKKPVGVYYTIDVPDFKDLSLFSDLEINLIAEKISGFLNNFEKQKENSEDLKNQTVLVAGLGNREITPDSLGPRTISKIISTRHVKSDVDLREQFKKLRSVAAIAPGVLGQTGIEISEIIKSIVEKIRPYAVIVIDALVSQVPDRLGSTIQISNSGISPGSGVMNKRKEISKDFLGVPIISIGIPTVVEANTLIKSILSSSEDNIDNTNKLNNNSKAIEPMIVTPKDIDNIIKHSSNILALIINKALQSNLTIDDIKILTS